MSDAAQKAVEIALRFMLGGQWHDEDYAELAAHVLAVLSETHAVVELPEADIDDEGYHWFREGSNATEIHAYPGGGVGYQRVWEWTPDQMRDVAACWAAAARVAEGTQ